MKVGIVTITELDNFGNRLQNFALQQVLRELGHDVDTIPNLIIYKRRRNAFYKGARKVYGLFKWLLQKDRHILSSLDKQANFQTFDSEFISFSNRYSTIDYIPENLDAEYDVFIAGSDQIWNSHFVFNFEFNFLMFAQPFKRISYAASFGSDHVKAEYAALFAKYLSEMPHISVRELAGKRIVEELTSKTAAVVLDPTLLMNAGQWHTMERKPGWIVDEKFILTYYLGDSQNRQELLKQLYREHPKYESYQIVDISDSNLPMQYASRPDEFLWLTHHAALMVTDSFHGTVFSIIFGTPFFSDVRIDRCASMQSRVDSLFELLGIEKGRLITDVKDQPGVYSKLEAYRQISMEYLKNALADVEGALQRRGMLSSKTITKTEKNSEKSTESGYHAVLPD